METSSVFDKKDDFLCYLMIYASYVDFEFSMEEKALINDHFGAASFERWHSLFLSKGDFAQLKLLMDHKHFFIKSEKDKEEVGKLLIQVFGSDGDYSKIEQNQLHFFKHLFES